MRIAILSLVAAIHALSVTSAHCADAEVYVPVWAKSAPAPADYEEAYPAQAMRQGIDEGRVTLACTIRADRTLDCSVQTESPGAVGFGAAALRVVEKFVVRPVEQDPRLVVGSRVVVPIAFHLQ